MGGKAKKAKAKRNAAQASGSTPAVAAVPVSDAAGAEAEASAFAACSCPRSLRATSSTFTHPPPFRSPLLDSGRGEMLYVSIFFFSPRWRFL